MSDAHGWPDAARPGYPQNPGRTGPHWLKTDEGDLFVGHWDAQDQSWFVCDASDHYLGPCLTPAEVSELIEAARREEREENAALIDCGCDNRDAVLARLESKGERYAAYLCQQGSACCALQAATIRARGDA